MSEWLDNQKNSRRNFRQLLQEKIEKANPRREFTAAETKRLAKLEAIAEKLKLVTELPVFPPLLITNFGLGNCPF